MQRRTLLRSMLAGSGQLLAGAAAHASAALSWPRDFGAHPGFRTEWWYVTGALHEAASLWGFQITFFRTRTGFEVQPASRFDAGQLLFAHAALSDPVAARLRHDQRIARAGFDIAGAAASDTDVVLRTWSLQRTDGTPAGAAPPGRPLSHYRARVDSEAAGFGLDLHLQATQPVLLQGRQGLSRKGPGAQDISRYYSEPQLEARGTLSLEGRPHAVQGRAWLDHEWSDAFVPAQAVGWDWVGMNLADGAALTAFRLRRADGSSVYAGGSFRAPGQSVRDFESAQVQFTPQKYWTSARSNTRYPVQWALQTPAGEFRVLALIDDQELDSRASTGTIYWEGLSELLDAAGQRVGTGYLEMTGYASALHL